MTTTTTTRNSTPRQNFNHNRYGVEGLPEAMKQNIQSSAPDAETAYELAYATDHVHRLVAGLDNIYEDAGNGYSNADWLDSPSTTGIEGGRELYELAERMADPAYKLKTHEEVFLKFMDKQTLREERAHEVDESKLLAAHPNKDFTQASRIEADNVITVLDTKILPNTATLTQSQRKSSTDAEGSRKKIKELLPFIDRQNYTLGMRTSIVSDFMAAGEALEANPNDDATKKAYAKAKADLADRQSQTVREASLFHGIALLDGGKYANTAFTDKEKTDNRKRMLKEAKDPGPASVAAAASNAKESSKSEKKEKKEKEDTAPEIIRERRRLASIMDELATVQAKAGFSPLQRGFLKRNAAQLEAQFNAQIKKTAMHEMIEYGLVDPSNPDPDDIAQYAEDRTAKAYYQLAGLTKEKPGSRTMEFFGKHGSKLVLGATALGFVLGGGFGGGITGAAMSMGLRTMAKRYDKKRGTQFDALQNNAQTDDNKKDFYTNNQLNVSAKKAVSRVRDTRNDFAPLATDTDAEKADKAKKRQKYFNEVFNKAFDGAGTEASKQFNRAVEKEYTSGFLGSIAVGAAVGTTVYVGGHMVGNALSYQFMGGPGSARWALSTLDYDPTPGMSAEEISSRVGYDPTYMSIQDAALSNFKPLEQWGWWRGL